MRSLKVDNDSSNSNEFHSDTNDAHDIPEENDKPSNEYVGNNEEVLISGTNVVSTTEAKQQCKLLLASTLAENVEAAMEEMQLLSFERKEHGSVMRDRKFKFIIEKLFTKVRGKDGSYRYSKQYIGQNILVFQGIRGCRQLSKTEEKNFRILKVYSKNGKSWHICDKGRQVSKKG